MMLLMLIAPIMEVPFRSPKVNQPQQLRVRIVPPQPDVKITKVESIAPPMELTNDPLKGAQLHMTSGRFQHNNGPIEKIENPVIEFKSGNNSILSISVLNRADDTAIQFVGPGAGVSVAAKIDAAAIAGDKLAQWLKAAPARIDLLENTLSKLKFKWENSKFKANAQPGIVDSVGGRAVVGADQKRGPEKTKLEFKLESWDGWDLTGEIIEGVLTSP